MSVMLEITVLLENGGFASGEIEEYIFFMVTFQMHFKARSPMVSVIRDFVHPWRLIVLNVAIEIAILTTIPWIATSVGAQFSSNCNQWQNSTIIYLWGRVRFIENPGQASK